MRALKRSRAIPPGTAVDEAFAIAEIRAMVRTTTPTYENEWLDFKENPRSLDDAGRILSKAMSAFANTGGGVVVWGIRAKPDATGIDHACDLSFIDDPHALRQRLVQLMQHATDPPVAGVDIRAYSDPRAAGKGVVLCLIPESSFKPHRAERVSGKPYYMRIVDRFEIIPHPHLRNLFYPRSHPQLSIEMTVIEASISEDASGIATIRLGCTVRNTGLATAKEIFLAVKSTPAGQFFNSESRSTSIQAAINQPEAQFEAARSLHPQCDAEMFRYLYDAGRRSHSETPPVQELHFEFSASSLDQQPQSASIHFTGINLRRGERKTARFRD